MRVVVAVLLLLSGAGGLLTQGHGGPLQGAGGGYRVQGQTTFDAAAVDGVLTLQAWTGALLLKGQGAGVHLQAEDLEITLVRVQKRSVNNPVGGDISVVDETSNETHRYRGAGTTLRLADAISLVYVYQDAPPEWPRSSSPSATPPPDPSAPSLTTPRSS